MKEQQTQNVSRYAHGATGLSGFPDAVRRGQAIAEGLRLMAKECGSDLAGSLQIDANGEIALNCPEGVTYGEQFARMMNRHGSRTGALVYGYNAHRQAGDRWSRMNHFSVQAMLEEYEAAPVVIEGDVWKMELTREEYREWVKYDEAHPHLSSKIPYRSILGMFIFNFRHGYNCNNNPRNN